MDTVIPPAYYNFHDLIGYAFERNIVEAICFTEATLPQRMLNCWLFAEASEEEANLHWKHHRIYYASDEHQEDYVAFVLYDLDPKKERKIQDFIPRKTLPLLEYFIRASNNLAILSHRISAFSNNLALKKDLRIHAWYLRQAIDFYWFGIGMAWKYAYMETTFIPCDLLEYLDVYWRASTHSRDVYQRLGYDDQYRVPWHPSLCKYYVSSHLHLYVNLYYLIEF